MRDVLTLLASIAGIKMQVVAECAFGWIFKVPRKLLSWILSVSNNAPFNGLCMKKSELRFKIPKLKAKRFLGLWMMLSRLQSWNLLSLLAHRRRSARPAQTLHVWKWGHKKWAWEFICLVFVLFNDGSESLLLEMLVDGAESFSIRKYWNTWKCMIDKQSTKELLQAWSSSSAGNGLAHGLPKIINHLWRICWFHHCSSGHNHVGSGLKEKCSRRIISNL